VTSAGRGEARERAGLPARSRGAAQDAAGMSRGRGNAGPVRGTAALQRQAGNAAVHELLSRNPPVPEPLTSVDQGCPIEPGLRRGMESRFGQGFGDVRLHSGDAAAASASRLGAMAYTAGSDIVLGPHPPELHSVGGRYLMSHELAHVVQQRRGGTGPVEGGGLEAAANQTAASFALQPGPVSVSGASSVGVSRISAAEFAKGLAGVVDKLPLPDTEKARLKQQIDIGVGVIGPTTEVPKQLEAQVELVTGPLTSAPPPTALQPRRVEPAKAPVPVARPEAGPAPSFEPVLWSTRFQSGFSKGVHGQNLQASWQRLDADLASSDSAKVDFGLGMMAGLPTAAGSMGFVGGDLGMQALKERYPALFDPKVTTVKSDEQFVRDFGAGMKQFGNKLPGLARSLALHPGEYGQLLGQIAGARIKADVFLEKPEPGANVPRGRDGRPLPTSPSELFVEFASDLVAKGRLDAPERRMRERGLALGKAAGDVVLNVALLFIEPEEAAAKTLGISRAAIQGIKNSRIGREILVQLELVPELKSMADAQRAAEAAQVGLREAKVLAGEAKAVAGEAKAVTEEAGRSAATTTPQPTPSAKGAPPSTSPREPTINRFGEEEVDELVSYWRRQMEATDDSTLRKKCQDAIDVLTKRGRVKDWQQSEKEVVHLYSLIGGSGETAYIHGREANRVVGLKNVVKPDVVPPNVLGEVKNWEMIHINPKTAEQMMDNLARQIRQRNIHGPANIKSQTIILDLRGQSLSEAQLQRIGKTFADKAGLPIENIQLVVWATP
jgi:Domain of unknown function (DUF4157)